MIQYLTHEEACRLVESAIERCAKTLAYIRLRLEKDRGNEKYEIDSNGPMMRAVDRANLLCNINWYGAYLSGARAMARAMEEWDLLDFPKRKAGHGGYTPVTIQRANPIVNKAILDLFLSSSRNLEYCLEGLPNNIEIHYDTERDKKGKLVKCRAFFAKKVTRYEEI